MKSLLSLAVVLLLTTSTLARRNLQAAAVHEHPSIQRTKSCRSGSDLVGKQCVSTEVVEPQFICPAGTASLDGDCVTFARAKRLCPTGSTLSADSCASTEVTPASFVCNEGELQGNRCRITTEVKPVCPGSSEQRGNQCVHFTSPQKVCTAGYQLQGEQCARQDTFPASATCPADFTLAENEQCTRLIPVAPRCSAGYSLAGSECIKEVSKIYSPCPVSFSSSGIDGCQRAQEFPVRPVCPPEFILDSSSHQCVQEILVAPTCPAGTSRGQLGQCERSVAKTPVCDSAEEFVNGRCRRTSLFPSELRCASGYALVHNKCKKVTAAEPVARCSVGILKDDRCITESSSSPLIQCPAGYQLAKGPKCVRDVTYDCSKTVVKTECEMPAFVAELSHHRQLHASSDYKAKAIDHQNANKLAAAAQPHESKAPRCTPVTHVIPQSCTKSESVPIEYICADGSTPSGKSCPATASSPTEPYCRAGQLDKATRRCITIDVKPSDRVCPIGQLQADGNCLQTDEKPAALICPEGSQQLDGKDAACVVVQPEVVHPSKVVRRAPQEVCDFGAKQGRVCVEIERVPRSKICPSNSQDRDGRCVLTSEVIVPVPSVVTRPAQYVCSDGSTAQRKSCFTRDVIPAESVCRDGAVKEGSRCVHTSDLIYPPARITHAAARPVCYQGYQQQGGQCSLTSVQPAELQCPSNFIRYKNGTQECRLAHPRTPVCPAGTQKLESNSALSCVKKTYAPPQVTEIKVCTKGQPGC